MDRITVNPRQMGGVPCIRGLRIPVATVLGMLADGMTAAQVISELPPLEPDDIAAALFVHPQTVRYRMTQLRELYGQRLEDPRTVLELLIALGAPTS